MNSRIRSRSPRLEGEERKDLYRGNEKPFDSSFYETRGIDYYEYKYVNSLYSRDRKTEKMWRIMAYLGLEVTRPKLPQEEF